VARKDIDDALVLALAGGEGMAGAARRANVSDRTVRRRLAEEAFRRRVDQARTELVAAAVGRLAEGGAEAAVKLRWLVLNARAETTALGAARAVLDMLFRARQLEDLERRVSELEEHASAGVARPTFGEGLRGGPATNGPAAAAGG
jgi:hypothetical protein